jgi:tetratricopeptide (TPR) repeat protein
MDRLQASSILLQANELHGAASELQAVLRTPAESTVEKDAFDRYAHRRLAFIDATLERDAEAADHLEAIAAIDARSSYRLPRQSDEELTAEIHWRRLRAARTAHDEASVKEHLDQLVRLNPAHADIALDVVPLLRERGRDREADAFFTRAYQQLRARVDANPNDPEEANNLAWLCARSKLKLDEAVELAGRAVKLAPDNPAFLDTAAEAHFATGDAAKAVELETRALELRPNDKFMLEQLERFKKGR